MARPSKLSEDITRGLEEAFGLGQTSIQLACDAVGIGTTTYHEWMRKGKEGQAEYREFRDRMKKARAEAQAFNLAIIRRAAREGQWQAAAWWLERSAPHQWGRRTQVEVVTPEQVEAEIARLEAELGEDLED